MSTCNWQDFRSHTKTNAGVDSKGTKDIALTYFSAQSDLFEPLNSHDFCETERLRKTHIRYSSDVSLMKIIVNFEKTF